VQGDLVRFAVATIVRKLAIAGGLQGSVIAHGEILRTMIADEEYQLQWEDNIRGLKRVIERYLQRGAPAKAREFIVRALGAVKGMKEGYWRDQYEAEILRRYGHVLDGATSIDRPRPAPVIIDAIQAINEYRPVVPALPPASVFDTEEQADAGPDEPDE
jgi:hypothetical protein